MFTSLPLNIILFVISAAAIWFVGFKLTIYLDIIAERTGIGRAITGLLLLGISTSLPEIVTTVTASASGDARLAGSNLLGGVAIQITILAVVEMFALKGKPLTSMAPKAILLMQGVVLVIMTTLAVVAISAGEILSFKGVGLWPVIFLAVYVASCIAVYRYEINPKWSPNDDVKAAGGDRSEFNAERRRKYKDLSVLQLSFRSAGAALSVLVTGYVITLSAEGIVNQAMLSSNFVGATFLALATSLPEVTTTWSAFRIGAFTMAIANILGTNAVEVALFLPADLFYSQGPIINELGNKSIFLAAVGILLTCVYLLGILERRNRTILGMGIDSATVLLLYIACMAIFYFI